MFTSSLKIQTIKSEHTKIKNTPESARKSVLQAKDCRFEEQKAVRQRSVRDYQCSVFGPFRSDSADRAEFHIPDEK